MDYGIAMRYARRGLTAPLIWGVEWEKRGTQTATAHDSQSVEGEVPEALFRFRRLGPGFSFLNGSILPLIELLEHRRVADIYTNRAGALSIANAAKTRTVLPPGAISICECALDDGKSQEGKPWPRDRSRGSCGRSFCQRIKSRVRKRNALLIDAQTDLPSPRIYLAKRTCREDASMARTEPRARGPRIAPRQAAPIVVEDAPAPAGLAHRKQVKGENNFAATKTCGLIGGQPVRPGGGRDIVRSAVKAPNNEKRASMGGFKKLRS